MAKSVWTLDEASIRKLKADHDRLARQVENLRRLAAGLLRTPATIKEIRFGHTTTNSEFPTYPTSPADTFVVQFDDRSFPETTGQTTLTETPWASKYVVARHLREEYVAEDEQVELVKVNGQWWILPVPRINFCIGVLNDDLLYGATAGFSVYRGAQLAETDSGEDITVSAWELQDPGDIVVAGTPGVASWNGDAWYYHAAKCAAASS